MTKYIKTGITEFEQFNGSDEMIDKYELIDAGTMLGIHHSPELYLTGSGKVDVGDWIATGVGSEHWPVKDEIFKKTYKKLPVIPECVNYAIEWFEQNDDDLGEVFRNVYEDLADNWHESPQLKVAETWIIKRPEDFSRAWLDGYEVAEGEE